jgi:NNP family nitrate/nitrite transporter-like MFS transporter
MWKRGKRKEMKLLPLFVFWGLWFLNFSTRAVFSPLLPLIEDTLSLSHGEAGGLFTSLGIGYSLTLLIAGRFASVWGYKRTIVAGYIGVGLVFLVLQWAESYFAFHMLFFLLGVATGTYLPAIMPIITDTYPPRNWGKVIGFHDSAASLSVFFIPIFVALGHRLFSWRILLLVLGAASLLLPIYFWKVSIEPKGEGSQQKGRILDLFKRRTTWIIGFVWIFAAGSALGLYSILPLYLIRERGIDFHFANTLFGISRVGGVFVSILSGFLIDRYGYRTMLMLSLVTTGLSTIGLSLSSTLPMILVTLILQATLSLTFFPAGLAAISNLTPLSERSMAIGVAVSIGVIFGMGGAPFVLGLIADSYSFQVGIIWLGILTTLSSLAVSLLGKA